jgi:hypothetical protein
MGCDIHGWMEVRSEQWNGIEELDLDRAYDTFGLFFGVRNYARFKPVAEDRGIPSDANERVRGAYAAMGDDAHSPSWLTWADVENMDSEQVVRDSRIHVFDAAGHDVGKFESSNELSSGDYLTIQRGGAVVRSGLTFRLADVKALENLPSDWSRMFSRMGDLAKTYGAENVRIVVWFDN